MNSLDLCRNKQIGWKGDGNRPIIASSSVTANTKHLSVSHISGGNANGLVNDEKVVKVKVDGGFEKREKAKPGLCHAGRPEGEM